MFYVDASVPLHVAKALEHVRKDITYPGKPGCPVASPAVPDEDWLPVAGTHGWLVIMRDKRIRVRPGERAQLVRFGVRAFCLTTAGNASKWDVLSVLVQHWDQMERLGDLPGPFLYAVTGLGIRPIIEPPPTAAAAPFLPGLAP